MQALQPMQRNTRSPSPVRALRGISGSVISARVIPNASATPAPISASACAGSTTRVVAISGGPSLNGSVSSPIRSWGVGGGGAIPVQPSNVAELPTARWT